ncbi:MAG: LCP family protein [Treponema sp.]|nr:LCP family protein [Treponema sp.]
MHRKTTFVGRDASPVLLFAIILFLAVGIFVGVRSLRVDPIAGVLAEGRVISMMYVIEEDNVPLGTFVLLYYPATRRAAVFDVPGDLGMLIRRVNRVDRIDTVFDRSQISVFENMVGSILGIDISFSIVMSTENLSRAVDLLEGIELFVPSRVHFHDESGQLVMLPSGIHRFSGDKALTFMTHQAPGEDREVVAHRRQRFFLSFLQRQVEMNEKLQIPEVARMYRSFMQTGINERARVRLFDEFAHMDMGRISMQAVGGTPREVSGQTLFIPLHDGHLIRDIVGRTLASITRPAEGADRHFTVEVLNGTTSRGLAGRTADLLREFGYDVISVGNAEHSGFERTVVIDRSGYEAMARNFANIIRLNNIVFESQDLDFLVSGEMALRHTELRSDFTLIIGRDFNGRYVVGN